MECEGIGWVDNIKTKGIKQNWKGVRRMEKGNEKEREKVSAKVKKRICRTEERKR